MMHQFPRVVSARGGSYSSRFVVARSSLPRTITNNNNGTGKNSLRPFFSANASRALGGSTRQILSRLGLARVSGSSLAVTTRTMSNRWFASSPVADLDDTGDKFVTYRRKGIRNVAIIAHVDHGKTTLVDKLLMAARKSQSADDHSELTRLMDSGELEIERGITIKSKVTRVDYKTADGNNMVLNIVDTPGHSDFSGEVDRILSMVDGVCLLVDAVEGPMTQTKYVLTRALNAGLKPIVVLNKCDRPEAAGQLDSGDTETRIRDLFGVLGASQDQLDYVTAYASARSGWVVLEDPLQALELATDGFKGQDEYSMKHLLDAIIEHIPEPSVRCHDLDQVVVPEHALKADQDDDELPSLGPESFTNDRFSMTVVTVGADNYLGRTCTGRIMSGSIALGEPIRILKRNTAAVPVTPSSGPPSVAAGIFCHKGIERVPLPDERAYAGDVITLAGVPELVAVGDTVTSAKRPVEKPIETPPLAPPTLCMEFGANNGPLAGKEGTQLTSSKIRERLIAETDNNVTLKVENSKTDADKTTVYARGELQLGILVETMRREGFEMILSPPKILTTKDEQGRELEPFEEVIIDVDSEYAGTCVSILTGKRKGTMVDMRDMGEGKTRLVVEVPSRGLLGFSSEIASLTKGSAVVNHIFLENRPHLGMLEMSMGKSKLVATSSGKATAYALDMISARGTLFVTPGQDIYSGMVIGENAKTGIDLEVNAVRTKELTNMRTTAKEEGIKLSPPKLMTLEDLIGYMDEDEVIEVTPKSIRLRKALLDAGAREQANKVKTKQLRVMKANK